MPNDNHPNFIVDTDTELATVRMVGEIRVHTAVALKELLLEQLNSVPSVQIDMSSVELIDTAVIQILVAARNYADITQKKLSIEPISASVSEVLQMVGIHKTLSTSEQASL